MNDIILNAKTHIPCCHFYIFTDEIVEYIQQTQLRNVALKFVYLHYCLQKHPDPNSHYLKKGKLKKMKLFKYQVLAIG